MNERDSSSKLWFSANVPPEVAERLSEVWGVERDGTQLMCSPMGLFNLRSELKGASLFFGDGGAVLNHPGHRMIMFQQNQAR